MSEGGPELRCVIADDQPFVRDSVSRLLRRRGVDVVGLAADGSEAIQLIRELEPDVAVVDFDMPGASGVEVAVALRGTSATGIVLHSGIGELAQLGAALAAGVRGIVSKEAPLDELLAALQAVAGGGTHVGPALACELLLAGAAEGVPGVEGRAGEVLRLTAEGLGTQELAARLGIAPADAGAALEAALAALAAEPRTVALGAALRRLPFA